MTVEFMPAQFSDVKLIRYTMLLSKTTVAGELASGCDCALGSIDRVRLWLYASLGTGGGSHANVIVVVEDDLSFAMTRKFAAARGTEI